eukprot:768494-Hanusia_phi.AAC.3
MNPRGNSTSLSEVYLNMLDRFAALLHASRLMRRAWAATSSEGARGVCFLNPIGKTVMRICLTLWRQFYRKEVKKRRSLVGFTWHREMVVVKNALVVWMQWRSERKLRRSESDNKVRTMFVSPDFQRKLVTALSVRNENRLLIAAFRGWSLSAMREQVKFWRHRSRESPSNRTATSSMARSDKVVDPQGKQKKSTSPQPHQAHGEEVQISNKLLNSRAKEEAGEQASLTLSLPSLHSLVREEDCIRIRWDPVGGACQYELQYRFKDARVPFWSPAPLSLLPLTRGKGELGAREPRSARHVSQYPCAAGEVAEEAEEAETEEAEEAKATGSD